MIPGSAHVLESSQVTPRTGSTRPSTSLTKPLLESIQIQAIEEATRGMTYGTNRMVRYTAPPRTRRLRTRPNRMASTSRGTVVPRASSRVCATACQKIGSAASAA